MYVPRPFGLDWRGWLDSSVIDYSTLTLLMPSITCWLGLIMTHHFAMNATRKTVANESIRAAMPAVLLRRRSGRRRLKEANGGGGMRPPSNAQ